MMKQFLRVASFALAVVMVLSVLVGIAPHAQAASFSSVYGWYETIVAQISGVSDAQVTGVSWSGTMSGSLTGDDLKYLVRDSANGVRIDIPGVKAGTYTLTVTTSSGTLTRSNISVAAYDRSGYAHWNYTEGVGAYKDDGTLKDNAIVLYITDANKDSVSVTSKDGTKVTGIGNILNSGGQDTTGKGTTSKGGAANSNQGILKKLAQDNTPLVVRIVGNVTAPEGLTAWGSIDYGGNTDDNGSMARMQSAKNITIEGIGNDATVNGWGFAVISQSGNRSAGIGKNFEFRNLTFKNVPEDCIGMEGSGSDMSGDPIEHCWVHHCAFYGPTNIKDASEDQDKGGGDGAVDFKRGQYYTMSYCYYEGYHKTNLIGGGDTQIQYNITWHHNYYKNCESRAPLARQANIHIYNNVFEKQSSYCISLRANTYIYSEYNVYLNSKVYDSNTGGVCKSYNNSFTGCSNTSNSKVSVVTDRNKTVTSSCKYANFDTNPAYGYVADGDYLLQTNTSEVQTYVTANAGPMKSGSAVIPDWSNPDPVEPSDPTEPTEPEEKPTLPVGTYEHNFTKNGLTSEFFTFTGCNTSTGKGTVSYNGLNLTTCLKMESATSVTFNAPADGTLKLVFHETGIEGCVAADQNVKLNGTVYGVDADNTVTIPVSTGSNELKRGSQQIYLFYMVYTPNSTGEDVHTHSYTSSVTTAATCTTPGLRTYVCSCGDSYTQTIAATGHSYKSVVTAATCVSAGYTTYTCSKCGDSYTGSHVAALGHSFVDGYCTVCREKDPGYVAPLFDLAGANVNLGNDLTMNFFVNSDDLDIGEYYMEMVKEYADGSTVTTQVPFEEWEAYYGVMWMASLEGMAAKEMADTIYVTVYNADGTAASNTWTDSIRDYCIRQLNSAAQANIYTLLVDMLNYGSAAQIQFNYNTDDLANSTLTAAQKGYATQNFDLSDYENNIVKGTNYIGSSLSLETNIQLTVYFNKLESENGLKAVVSYTDHLGETKSYEVAESEFTTLAGIYYGVVVDTLVAADVCQVVSVSLYDGDTLVGNASDSMESYAVRQSGDINIALMKFALSAYEYLN